VDKSSEEKYGEGFQGECKKGDGWKTGKHQSAKDATKEAMRHSEEKHGDKHLGFKW
jgi:hypothetical protein